MWWTKKKQLMMSGSELAIVRLELSSNLLARDAFACRVLVCFVCQVISFWHLVSQNHLKNTSFGVLS